MSQYKIIGKEESTKSGYKILGHASEEDALLNDEAFKPASPKKGWAGVKEDIYKIPGAAVKFGLSVPHKTVESAQQIYHHPLRALGNLGAGAGEGIIGAINLPHEGLKYLGNKNLLPSWLKKYNEKGVSIPFTGLHIPTHIGNLGVEHLVGLDKQKPGDEVLRLMGNFLPVSKLAKLIPHTTKAEKKLKTDSLKENVNNLAIDEEMRKDALERAELSAKHEFNVTDPEALQYKLNEAKKQEAALGEEIANPLEPTIPDLPPSTLEAPKAPEIGEPALPEAPQHEPIPPEHEYEPLSTETGHHLRTKEQALGEAESAINQHLGEGQIHHERFATRVDERRKALEAENKGMYNKLDEAIADKVVVPKNKNTAKKFLGNLSKLFKETVIKSDEAQALAKSIETAEKAKEIPVKDFLSIYRKTRNEAFDNLAIAKEHPNTDAGTKAYELYKKLSVQEKGMLNVLEESMGKEAFEQFQKAQAHFRENIAPMRVNSTFRTVAKKGKLGGSLLEHSVGNEAGQNILQQMIYSDPELMRLGVGQEFAGKVHKLHEPNELLQERYLPHMPRLQKLMEEHANALEEHGHATQLHNEAMALDKEQAAIAKARGKERAAAIKKREAAQEKHENEKRKALESHEKKKTSLQLAHEKAHAKYLEKKASEEQARKPIPPTKAQVEARQKKEKQHKETTQKIKRLEELTPDLRKKAQRVNQTLKDKHDAMNAYEKHMDEIHKLQAIAKKLGKYAYKVGVKYLKGGL